MTSDTTNVMPATALELKYNCHLSIGMTWTPCFAHSIELDINNQPAIVRLPCHVVQTASKFGRGAANKLVATLLPNFMCWCFQNARSNKLFACS
jgi:hypothetical protein